MLLDDAMTDAEPRTILLLFANDRVGGGYLRNLARERRRIKSALKSLRARFEIVVESNLTRDRLFEILREYGPTTIGVHFGGHAHPDALYIEDDDGRASELKIEGFAGRLAQMPELRWVFLNGCATRAQVESIHEGSKATVVATTRSIRDDAAAEFAEEFFANLALDKTLDESYSAARDRLLTRPGEGMSRFLRPAASSPSDAQPPWRIVPSPRRPDGVSWRLSESVGRAHERAEDVSDTARGESVASSVALTDDHPAVFIAHASADADSAQALKRALADIGIRAFIDKDLPPGERWDVALPRAQSRARLTAVIISEHWPRYEDAASADSATYYAPEEVALGVAFARRHPDKHRLVPIVLPGVERGFIWYGVTRLTSISHQSWRETARQLARALDHRAQTSEDLRHTLQIGAATDEPGLTWLHLSDLRVGSEGISEAGALADLRAHILEEQHDRSQRAPSRQWPDLLCVTGDLTRDGSPVARAWAIRWLRDLAADFEPPLDPARILVAPGPADLKQQDPQIEPGAAFAAQTVELGLPQRDPAGFTLRDGHAGRMPFRLVALEPRTTDGGGEVLSIGEPVREATLARLPERMPLSLVLASRAPDALCEARLLQTDVKRMPHLWLAAGPPAVSLDDEAAVITVGRAGDELTYAWGSLTGHELTVDVMTHAPGRDTFEWRQSAAAPHRWPRALSNLLARFGVSSAPPAVARTPSQAPTAFEMLRFDRSTQWGRLTPKPSARKIAVEAELSAPDYGSRDSSFFAYSPAGPSVGEPV